MQGEEKSYDEKVINNLIMYVGGVLVEELCSAYFIEEEQVKVECVCSFLSENVIVIKVSLPEHKLSNKINISLDNSILEGKGESKNGVQ